MQKFSISNSCSEFDEQTNIALSDGKGIVPHTSYAVTVYDNLPLYCFIGLQNTEQQIIITADNMGRFLEELAAYLDSGFWVIPGTIYITNVGPDITSLEQNERTTTTFYTLVIGD